MVYSNYQPLPYQGGGQQMNLPYQGGGQVMPMGMPLRQQADQGAVGNIGPQTPQGQTGADNPLNTIGGLFNSGYYQPYQAQQQIGESSLENQLTDALMNYQRQSGYYQQDANFQLQGNALSGQEQAIQRAALQRQAGLIPQYENLANQGFEQQRSQANYGAGQQTQASNSQWTPTGNFTSIQHGRDLGNIQQQLQYQLANIGRSQQQSELGFGEQKASLADSQKEMDIAGQRLGLSSNEIRSRLQRSLQELGLSDFISPEQMFSEMQRMGSGGNSMIGQLIGNVTQASGITLPSSGGSPRTAS